MAPADWRERKVGPEAHLVEVEGDTVIPTELCGGPWSPDAQHGSAVGATLAWAVEQVPTPVPMRAVRFTVDLLSPVPLTPLRWEARCLKAGKRIAVVDAELWNGERLAARATCLLMRSGATVELPADPPIPPEPPLPPRDPLPDPWETGGEPFVPPGFAFAMDYVRTRGEMGGGSPACAWMRLRCGVVAGSPVTPFQWAVAAADMGSQLGGYLSYRDYRTINADFSLHLLRMPATAWIGLDGTHRVSDDAVGQTLATLFDDDGLIGHMQSSVHVDRWGDA
jgi:hypothetical protein